MNNDVLVVGAGPVGCIAAGHIARQGHSVLILEDHHAIGRPMQCGGLVSPRLREMVEFEIDVLNAVSGAHVHAPSGEVLTLSAQEGRAIVIDRTRFDEDAAAWAVEQGAEIRLGSRVTRVQVGESGVTAHTARGTSFHSHLIIGADGPASITAHAASLPPIREFVSGFEIEAINRTVDPTMVEVYTGKRMGEGFFSWVIPSGGERVRIGTGVHRSNRTAMDTLHYLMNHSIHAKRFSRVQPISLHGGTIPIGIRDRLHADRMMVIGDAAGLSKPVSGGGVITGIISARIASEVAGECLTNGIFTRQATAVYQKRLLGEIGKELKRAWKLRKAFMHLEDEELDQFISRLARPEVLKLMNSKGDIDYPGRMAMELIKASPGLLRFGLKYLGANFR